MEKILITFGTHPLAQRLGKLLNTSFSLLFASSEPFPNILLRQNYRKIPTGVNPTFAHEVLKICLDEGITQVLPLGKKEIQPLNETRVLFQEYGIELLVPQDTKAFFVLDNPSRELNVRVYKDGVDVLLGEQMANDTAFSGAGILSDSEEEMIWCLVNE